MQVYRGLDIGTGKVTPAEMRGVPHHLLDVVNPEEAFSVAEYQRLAAAAISECHERGRLPILAGGTGLYVRAVIRDYLFPDPGADRQLRETLQQRASASGPGALHSELADVDPVAAQRIHPNDVKRVIRALEVYALTGRTMTELQRGASCEGRYQSVIIGLTGDREMLYQRIENRVDKMLSDGLLQEVKGLLDQGLAEWLTSVQALGYKEFIPFFKAEKSLESCVERLKQETRRYAKRQLTWVRREEGVHWLNVDAHPSWASVLDEARGVTGGRWANVANTRKV
jgi:tRNA dimethylallyltransferase